MKHPIDVLVSEKQSLALIDEISQNNQISIKETKLIISSGESHFEPIVSIALIAAGYGLLSQIIKIVATRLNSGVIVTITETGSKIEKFDGVAFGEVIVVDPKGKAQKFESKDAACDFISGLGKIWRDDVQPEQI